MTRFIMSIFHIRIFVAKANNYPIHESVLNVLSLEKEAKLRDIVALKEFARRVESNKIELNLLLFKLKSEGKRIVAVSAPAKGMTLLNYCKLDKQVLDYVTEKSHLKIGSYTPGGHIPIFPDSKLLEDMPDYSLLLAWNFADEIMKNNQEYIDRGGKFIIPIPSPRIV